MNKLEFLGRGSGYNVTEGNTCGYIKTDDTLLLIDCGEGNVHTSLRVLSELVPKQYRKQVYCIHIDGENFIEKAEEEGFQVVDLV